MVDVEVIVAILLVLLWVVAGLIGVVILALCTPLRLSGQVDGLNINEASGIDLETLNGQFRFAWLLGLVKVTGVQAVGHSPDVTMRLAGISIKLGAGASRQKKRKAMDRAGKRKEEMAGAEGKRAASDGEKSRGVRGSKSKKKAGISIGEVRLLLPEVRWLMAKFWSVLRLQAKGDIVYGFEDPATTGFLEALKSVVPLPEGLRLTSDFTEERLEGWVQLSMTVYPLQMVAVMIRTVFRKGVRRIWWTRVKTRFA